MPHTDPEAARQYRKSYSDYKKRRAAVDPEYRKKLREYSRRWKDKNREAVNEQARLRRRALRLAAMADPVQHEAMKAKGRADYAKHRERRRADANRKAKENRVTILARAKERYAAAKDAAIRAYGGYRCACCSVTVPEFLAIDHINGGGNRQRKVHGSGMQFYLWLKRNDYPEGFRILCHNCNYALGQFGYCPHQQAP